MNGTATAWIGTSDLFMCLFGVMLYTAQIETQINEGPKQPAAYLITAEWSLDQDADVDLWVRKPDKKLVFYESRQQGCATLDLDNRGFPDSVVTLADGTMTKMQAAKETIALRCIEPGEWTIAAHLFNYRENDHPVDPSRRDLHVKVHVEVIGLNPTVRVLYAKDVVLDRRWQAENLTAFNLSNDGAITLTESQIEPIISAAYRTR